MPSPRQPSRRSLRLVALLLVLAGAAGAGWVLLAPEAAPTYQGPVWLTERGPLTISVSETGTIESRERVVLKCEVNERSTTITYIVEEGTRVQEGDLLVELDSSVLQDELYDEEIDVLDTEADFLAARENLEVVKNQVRSDEKQAELDLRFAREDLAKYIEGDYPKQLREAEIAVTLAEEELQQAQENLSWSERLYDRRFLSGGEVDQDRLTTQRRAVELELARAEVDLLREYSHARQLAQLEADVEQAELALERVRRKARADVVQAEASLRARELQLERQRGQLREIQVQVEKCRILAPVSGMVVYATTGRGDRDDEPLQVGREVRDQEELIHIPVDDAKTVRVKIHESALEKVEPGLPVRVTVEAAAGRVLHGTVARISPLPDAQSRWLNPDLKVYDTEIWLDGDASGVRTGMSCRAEIVVQELEDVLHVPVQAVVRVDEVPTVWVVEEGELVPRPVVLGLDDNRRVHVLEGLSEGETVALAPPLEAGVKDPARPRPQEERTIEVPAESAVSDSAAGRAEAADAGGGASE